MFNKLYVVPWLALVSMIVLLFVSCSSDDNGPVGPDGEAPAVTTDSVSAISQTTAQCWSTVTSDGGTSVTARGICWSTNPSPTIGNSTITRGSGTGAFTVYMPGLTGNTTYYVRAFATNSAGINYGNTLPFTTYGSHITGTVTDVDGNVYQTVKIGNQWWMAENLRVTRYRNREAIPNVESSSNWKPLTTGAYCNYDNSESNAATYGRLYNWHAVRDGRRMAPEGWHVPSNADWETLIDYLGGNSEAGGKLKEAGTVHWSSPNTGATNESGFRALPGGSRDYYGRYIEIGDFAEFWSATVFDSRYAWWLSLRYNGAGFDRRYNGYLREGFSVRCVKD